MEFNGRNTHYWSQFSYLRSSADRQRFWKEHPTLPQSSSGANDFLQSSSRCYCPGILTILIEKGADPNLALDTAIIWHEHVILDGSLNLARTKPENYRTDYLKWPLFHAAERDEVELLQKLEQYGFRMDTQAPICSKGYRFDLLTHAAMHNSQKVMIYLKQKGLKIDNSANKSCRLLDSALDCGDLQSIDNLLTVGSKPTSPSALGCTLDRAFLMNNRAILYCLLKHNVKFFSPIVAKAYQAQTKTQHELDLVDNYKATVAKVKATINDAEQDDTRLALSWIDKCVVSHKFCTITGSIVPSLPSRVLDISGSVPFLFETAGQRGLYATLSHCWKLSASVATTTANVAAHNKGFNLKDFSKIFQNAISIACSIGVDYLWIDALCILQDSKEDWDIESQMMAEIYQNAIVNIAIEDNFDTISGKGTHQPKAESDAKPDGPLNERAWILQERLLAPRTITFCKCGIYWDCATSSASSKHPMGIPVNLDYEFKLREERIYREIVRTGTLTSVNQDVLTRLSTFLERDCRRVYQSTAIP